MSWRHLALVVTLGVGVVTLPPAAAQGTGSELPAVTIDPVARDAPNEGEWFAVEGEPGEEVRVEAILRNGADVDQQVTLLLADLTVDGDGTSHLGLDHAGVGAWGGFDEPRATVPAKDTARTSFRLRVPPDADPGDHLGAVVVESRSTNTTGINVVKRAAKRLYVTVPGDAHAAVEVDDIEIRVESTLVPRRAIVTARVRNTGNVRLEPTVTVNGEPMEGASLVMSSDSERYVATLPVSVFGTRHSFRVDVATALLVGAGPTASEVESRWIVPWWIFAAVFLAVLLVVTLVELRKRLS